MPEWLEAELRRELAPVEAPSLLAFAAPMTPAARRKLRLMPMIAVVAMAAVLLLAAVPAGTSPAAVNRYLERHCGIRLPIPAGSPAQVINARLVGAKGVAAVTYRLAGMESTVLIARASAVRGPEWKAHGNYAVASSDAQGACGLCHSSL